MEFAKSKSLKLKPKKFFISEKVQFGGSTVSAEKCDNEDLIFISPKNKRIKNFEELRKPCTKKDVQVLCRMLASLQHWNLLVPLEVPLLHKDTAGTGKFTWTQDLEQEYQNVKKVMCEQIRQPPYDKTKTLRLVTDGASSQGVGFVLFQWIDELDPSNGSHHKCQRKHAVGQPVIIQPNRS